MNPIKFLLDKIKLILFKLNKKSFIIRTEETLAAYFELVDQPEVPEDHEYSVNMKDFFQKLNTSGIDQRDFTIKFLEVNPADYKEGDKSDLDKLKFLSEELGIVRLYLMEPKDGNDKSVSLLVMDSEKKNQVAYECV